MAILLGIVALAVFIGICMKKPWWSSNDVWFFGSAVLCAVLLVGGIAAILSGI